MKIGDFDLKPVNFRIEVIPDNDKERLAFYDKLFYEAYQKKLRLKIWDIGIGMCSSVKGDYCLLCKVKKVKHLKDKKPQSDYLPLAVVNIQTSMRNSMITY